MAKTIKHRLGLIAWIALILLVAVAFAGYQRHITRRLDNTDRVSCQNRITLFQNQRLVLRYLHSHAGDATDPRTGRPWRIELSQAFEHTFGHLCKP